MDYDDVMISGYTFVHLQRIKKPFFSPKNIFHFFIKYRTVIEVGKAISRLISSKDYSESGLSST